MPEDNDNQTRYSFSEKWRKNPRIAFDLTQDENSEFQRWILNRNGYSTKDAFASELSKCSRILDAGCGNGRMTALLAALAPHAQVVGVDIAGLEVARRNTEGFQNIEYVYADLRGNLSALGLFDYIYCQEVLHHTGDARGSFGNLVKILKKGGKVAIYVYRKKGPVREFVDDHIRCQISSMSYDEALKICRQIADFGRRLAAIDCDVEVDDIPIIGVTKGRYPIQRLIYDFFMKCYWNPELSEEENSVVNYDWYHPQNCSRHTMEEVLGWFRDKNLSVVWKHEDNYGIVVHGIK
jgi:SAM-dependent methyltransferase